MALVLLADDDRIVRRGVRAVLVAEGHDVVEVTNGRQAVEKFKSDGADIVLLDIEMPQMNGFAACREIRAANSSVPILFLTANDSEVNEVRALGLGADDFIAKDSCSSCENWKALFMAHVSRALSRSADHDRPAPDVIHLGRVSVDLKSFVVRGESGTVRLTSTEGRLLQLLASRPSCYFTGERILDALRGHGYSTVGATLYVHVSNLRRKLGPAADRLESDRRFGFRLLA